MMMCLPYSQQVSTCSMPAAACPVASMTISTSGSTLTERTSSLKYTLPVLTAWWMVSALRAAAGQPTRVSAARARSGARSATATSRMPGVRCTWLRNIEPNLPAPINATRKGF